MFHKRLFCVACLELFLVGRNQTRHSKFDSGPDMPHQLQKPVVWLEILKALGMLAIIGYLDYATGYHKSSFLFYLVPIVFTFQRLGMGWTVGMCVLSALVWLVSNLIAGQTYNGWLTPLWNTALRLAVFLLVAALFAVRRNLQTEVRQSTTALKREIQERSRLEKELLDASEREQRRIGHDLHDGLCQHLTATALAGKVLAKRLAGQSMPEAEAANHIVGMVENAIELTRSLARGLHPIELHAEGLVDALRDIGRQYPQGIPCGMQTGMQPNRVAWRRRMRTCICIASRRRPSAMPSGMARPKTSPWTLKATERK